MPRLKKYLFYAIGEIILLTLSILVAIQLNNLNERSKRSDEVEEIYNRVYSDIDANIANSQKIVQQYQEMEYLFESVINNQVDSTMIDDGIPYLITGLLLYDFDTTGISQLKNKQLNDEAATELIQIYEGTTKRLEAYTKTIEKNTEENLIHWRDTKPWFADYINGDLPQESIEYFLKSTDYRNRVAYSYLAVYDGYIPNLKSFSSLLEKWKEKFPNKATD